MHDRTFYVLTMAVCATASTRIHNSASIGTPPGVSRAAAPSSKAFYQACLDALPSLIMETADFDLMRTEALLGMLCLEYNDIRGCYAHQHRYLAMCSEMGFHDEKRWPPNLSEIDIQERRRLVSSLQPGTSPCYNPPGRSFLY